MLVYYGVCTAVFGLIFGSFLNCVAMRIVRGEDFVHGRSHCMSCGHELSASDLIPVLSFLKNKGKCRYCGQRVSARYPVTELSFLILSVLLYLGIMIAGPEESIRELQFFKYWILTGCLFVLTLTDLESFEIPNGVLAAGLINWIFFTVLETVLRVHNLWWVLHHIIAGTAVGAAMLIMSIAITRVVGKDSMGGGDIKLYALLGLYLGYAGAYELVFLSCILGLIFAFARKKIIAGASKEFPFGPAIALSGYILIFFERYITEWYLRFL